jgi:thioredoxin 1
LTATPGRGAAYGAVLAALLAVSLAHSDGTPVTVPETETSVHMISVEDEEGFRRHVLEAETPTLVDFYADWCGPCQKLAPVLHELADEVAGRAQVVKINVDSARGLAQAHGVRSIPDVRVFVGGKQEAQLVGVQRKADYVRALLGDPSDTETEGPTK